MIIKPFSLKKEFFKLKGKGFENKGLSTGFDSLDPHLKLAKGYLAVLGAIPGSGKSELVDAIMVNMAIMHDWKTLFFSPENHPTENHMMKIGEKFIGKKINQFNEQDFSDAMDFLNRYFTWIYPEKPTLDLLLDTAQQMAERGELDCLVLDPWNNISHSRSGDMIHEYLSEALRKVIKLCRDHNILVIIVTHPTKIVPDKNGNVVVDMYSLSDGAMWRNKTDYGLIVSRPDMSKNQLLVQVQKLKNKWFGKLGSVMLDYDWITGRFKDIEAEEYLLPNQIRSAF